MDDIARMEELIEELRELLQDYDLDVHNDEGNADHIQTAIGGLDQLAGAVGDLVP